ncbi:MAG: hypothetical protein WBC05_11455 [Sedimentisphaerales bacterium]
MKSFRQIEKIVGCARAKAGRVIDERILTDAGIALTNSSINRPQALRPGPNIWRFIMESKITRYSAAAVITLAAALVLLSPFGTPNNGGIVWADVVEKVGEMRTLVHKERRIGWEIGQEEFSRKADVIRYASEEHGLVEHQYDDKGTLMFRAFFLRETKQFIIVFPAEKKYLKLSMPEDLFNRLTGMLTPRGLVDYYMSSQYTELGQASFDNFDAEGFEITDPNLLFPIPEPLRSMCPARDLVGRLWIDVETSLPVGTEVKFNTDRGLLTGFKKLHLEFRAYDLQWNAEIPEGIFDPNIPDDYTEFKVTDLIPSEAKAGLVGLVAIPAGLVFWKKRRKRAKATRHK